MEAARAREDQREARKGVDLVQGCLDGLLLFLCLWVVRRRCFRPGPGVQEVPYRPTSGSCAQRSKMCGVSDEDEAVRIDAAAMEWLVEMWPSRSLEVVEVEETKSKEVEEVDVGGSGLYPKRKRESKE